MQLRCYANEHEGAWEALCVDLDIAVQGDSFQAVYHDLATVVAQYVEYVGTLPADERRRLLHRKAPFGLRLRFAWAALALVFGRNGGGRAEFTLPTPA